MSQNTTLAPPEPPAGSPLRRIGSRVNVLYFAPLVVATLVLWITNQFFQAAPRVVYTLSDPITYPFSPSPDAVQQLTVTNAGNAKAERVNIRLSKPVLSAKIEKFSQADAPQLFDKNQPLEAVYPLLPPGGSFKVFFRVKSPVSPEAKAGINSADLKVTHQDGVAQDALSVSDGSSRTESLFGLIMAIAYVSLALWSLWSIVSQSSIYVNSNRDLQRILSNEKNWWRKEKDWQREREQALYKASTRYFSVESLEDIAESLPVLLLDSPAPVAIEPKEWQELRDLAEYNVAKRCEYFVRHKTGADIFDALDNVASFKQPSWLRPATWEYICGLLRANLLDQFRNPFYRLENQEFLRHPQPQGVNAEKWNELRSDVQRGYYREIYDAVRHSQKPLQELQKFDLSLLSEDDRQRLTDMAYGEAMYDIRRTVNSEELSSLVAAGKPDWMKELDWELLVDENERQQRRDATQQALEARKQELEQTVESFKRLRALCVGLIVTGQLGSAKPAYVSDQEWQELQLLQVALHTRHPQLSNDAAPSNSTS